MKDRPIKGVGETCPCGKAMYDRVARCDDSTDGLSLHYDICPACGFEVYAHCEMKIKLERYDEWKTQPTIYSVFAKELELIQDADIKVFVTEVFQKLCPDYFWYIPASVGGHHPLICRTKGGLVHHVKLAVAFADSLLDSLGIEDDLRISQVIAAVLLHDMLKRGPTENELDTWPNHREANRSHGRYCSGQLHEFLRQQAWSANLFANIGPIITAVRLHMGRWTWEIRPEELVELQINEVVRTTHFADYCASRALHQYLAERAVDDTMGYLK